MWENVSNPTCPILSFPDICRFLGVSLTRVLLASRDHIKRKPILVVCMTNHALDSFLQELHRAGITKLARLGSNSKEDWTKDIQLIALQRRLKRTTYEASNARCAYHQVEGQSFQWRSCGTSNQIIVQGLRPKALAGVSH